MIYNDAQVKAMAEASELSESDGSFEKVDGK